MSSLVSLVSQGHAEDALIGINQIETQTRLEWQSVTLVSSLPKLGSESIVVEYTIEYMYKIIALRSDFCTLNVVIFESGQTTGNGYVEP